MTSFPIAVLKAALGGGGAIDDDQMTLSHQASGTDMSEIVHQLKLIHAAVSIAAKHPHPRPSPG